MGLHTPLSPKTTLVLKCCVIALYVGVIAMGQQVMIRLTENGLSFADPWTESDTLRAGEGYATLGFTKHSGLPDLCFGNQFANRGTKYLLKTNLYHSESWKLGTLSERNGKFKVDSESFIYTHYPPGPHWIAGVATVLFGVGSVEEFRIIPVTIGLLGLAYLSWELFSFVGLICGIIALSFFSSIPMFVNMMHGLSYQGYSLALLLMELGLSLNIIRNGKISPLIFLMFFIIGHIQGWMGFDYIFIVTFTPFIVTFLLPHTAFEFKKICAVCMISLIGFISTELLHFWQVISYFEDADKAFSDLFGAATYRVTGNTYDNGGVVPPSTEILWDYLTIHTKLFMHFGFSVLYYSLAGILIVSVLGIATSYQSTIRLVLGIFLSLVVSSGWVMVMPQYAAQHWHFIPRHYFLSVFFTTISILIVAGKLKIQKNQLA